MADLIETALTLIIYVLTIMLTSPAFFTGFHLGTKHFVVRWFLLLLTPIVLFMNLLWADSMNSFFDLIGEFGERVYWLSYGTFFLGLITSLSFKKFDDINDWAKKRRGK